MDDELQETIAKRFEKRFSKYNEKVLYELGRTIKELGEVIPSDAYKLAQQLKYNTTVKDLEKELAKITNKSIEEIKVVLEHIAKENIQFAEPYYKTRDLNVPIYEYHEELQRIVNSMATLSGNEFINIARSTGFKLLDLEKKPLLLNLEETYQKVIDEAVYAITTGKESYNQLMRDTLKQLASSGVRKIEYESGYSRRIDTAIKMNVMDSMRQVSNETSKQLGKEFNGDGIEVSVHVSPAPDHEEVQGHQFSNEEFEKFQNHLDCVDYKGNKIHHKHGKYERRAISEYNCYHYIFSIILDVSKQLHDDKELQDIITNNNKGVEIDGKHYTNYEVTQLQRQLETEIRKAKEQNIIAQASGDDELILSSQKRITSLMNKYKQISKQTNMEVDIDKTFVPNYKSKKIKDDLYKDVTQDWFNKATPNSHIVKDRQYFEYENTKYKVDGKNVMLDYSKNEKETAEWLENTFGGEIYMIPRINKPTNISTPDYIWNNEKWDLKEINGESSRAIDNAIKRKKEQSNNFILDITKSKLTQNEVLKQTQKLYKTAGREWINKVIIKENKKVIAIYKRK